MGYMAEIIAVPPGAYPASPTPTPSRVRKSWGNVLTAAASPVAMLQSITMRPTLRFLLHLSTRMETGNVKITMDQ
jgi:ABC-type transporter lipoprotein component MlaA